MKIDVSLSLQDAGAMLWAYWLSMAIMSFGVMAIGSGRLVVTVWLVMFAHLLATFPFAFRHLRFGLVLFSAIGLISCSIVGALVAWLTPPCHWRDGLIVGAVFNLIASVILWDLRGKSP